MKFFNACVVIKVIDEMTNLIQNSETKELSQNINENEQKDKISFQIKRV